MRILRTIALLIAAAASLGFAASAGAGTLSHNTLLKLGRVALNPQPLPPGVAVMINPQPLPPRWSTATTR